MVKPYLTKRKLRNNFFIEAVDNLDIEPYLLHNNSTTGNKNDIVDKYKNHPSIKKIKENIKDENKFSFKDTTPQNLQSQILHLDTKKRWYKMTFLLRY